MSVSINSSGVLIPVKAFGKDNKLLEGVYDTKREAFRAVDIHLIKNGKEPELILKKA